MGIFSSKYKTTVGTSVTRVVEDDHVPNSIKTGIVKGMRSSDGQLVENVIEEMSNSVGVRAERMYRYGQNKYMYGLPQATGMDARSGEELVKSIIEEEIGQSISIDYYHYGPLNTLHVAWYSLQKDYFYDPVENKFVYNGSFCYLSDLVLMANEATLEELNNGSLEQWGTPAKGGKTLTRPATGNAAGFTPIFTDETIVGDYVQAEYEYVTPLGRTQFDFFPIPLTGYDVHADYFHVKYSVNGTTKYWLYRQNTGDYPTLDKLYETDEPTNGTYFPWLYFRYGKQSLITDKTTDEYKQSSKLADYLGMDYEAVATAMDENPDIDDVEQAMLMMAVHSNSQHPMDIRYLFDYFTGIYENEHVEPAVPRSTELLTGLLNRLTAATNHSIVIEDKRFKMSLTYLSMTRKHMAGVAGPKGSYTSGFGVVTRINEAGETVQETNNKLQIYRYQKTDASFIEILIDGLEVRYHVNGDYAVTADEAEDILLIPLDKSITENYNNADRELLYSRSLHYVFNSLVVTKIKWYQQSFFKVLMFIAAIVITIYNPPAGLAAFAAATGISLIVVAIVFTFLASLVTQLVFKLFVKAFGAKFAMLAAVVLIVYGGYQAFQQGTRAALVTAVEYVNVASGLVDAATKQKFEDLQEDYEAFQDMLETEQEKLDKAKDELSYDRYLAPLIVFGESPTDYYERTVHSGNIGVLAIDAVSNFVDLSLTLPTLQETLGEIV